MILLNGDLSIEDVVKIARKNYKVGLCPHSIERIEKAQRHVKKYVDEKRISYGITTGFGKFADVVIDSEQVQDLQKNLIMSHACGVGTPFKDEVVRAIMVLRANALCMGNSGIRVLTVEKIVELLNKSVHPIIPEKGSLGASGDLAPLAHMVLTMLGLGEARFNGEKMKSADALKLAGIEPLSHLEAKEGLALINGTQVLTACGLLATYDAKRLTKIQDIACSLTMEALNGITDAFDERVAIVRKHAGMFATSFNVRSLLENSKSVTKQGELRVQDPYSIRCVPQIHGASKDAIDFIEGRVKIEINSVTDNPLIFVEDDYIISAGNFHGQPLALPFDYLGIAAAEIANVSERRLERMVNPQLSFGLPAFLVNDGGVNSGFMIVQYSAASLVSENKVLAHPASVDSITSSANQEDLVSMGTIAARKGRDIVENATRVLAMEILAACQAIDLRGVQDKLGNGTNEAYKLVREVSTFINKDRIMNVELDKVFELIKSDLFIKKIENKLVKKLRTI